MTKAQLTTWIGTTLGVILAGVAAKFPQYAAFLVPVTTLLFGWLHLPQPGALPASAALKP